MSSSIVLRKLQHVTSQNTDYKAFIQNNLKMIDL